MAVKVLVVDDESGIRLLLGKIIAKQEGFEVVGEADSISEAVTQFTRLKPEVVFLDIEIGGGNGIECAKIIAELEPKTKIIFATAHSEYMEQAFEVYAFDYIVKPFNVERVSKTLERIAILNSPQAGSKKSKDKISKYEDGPILLSLKIQNKMPY